MACLIVLFWRIPLFRLRAKMSLTLSHAMW